MTIAAGLALAAALTACTSDPASAPRASAAAASTVQLTGAGSTFDAPFFNQAFPAYQQAHSSVAVSYAAVGSSAGKVNFGATDSPPPRPIWPPPAAPPSRSRSTSAPSPWPTTC